MFRKLLIPLDRSPLAEQAIGQAAAIARAAHAAIDVVLVHQPAAFAGFNDAPWNDEESKFEHRYVEAVAAELSSGAGVPVTHSVVGGEAVDMICKRAWDVDADLIVMTSHGRTGLSRAWLGSVASGVVRHSAIPVLMLRPVETKADRLAAHHLFAHVLVPLDGSVFAADILPSASTLAQCSGARVTLLRVVEPIPLALAVGVDMALTYPPLVQDDVETGRAVDEAKKLLEEDARRLSNNGSVAVDTEVIVGTGVARAIIEFVRGHSMDVIAMSTHGRGTSRLIMGSVADKVLRASELPMLLHRPIDVGTVVETAGSSAADRSTPSAPA
jgi:nucleotide-binding universal stress UspA family protein